MSRKLAMYDVRGIQDYIYKTAKVQDAIGASAIVEDIISEALKDAVEKESLSYDLEWYDENGVLPYDVPKASDTDVQVLYIGGGNAFVSFKDQDICQRVNHRMSRYVLEKTYSLQLAIAVTDQTKNYADDYKNIFDEMVRVKANMEVSKPFGALPVMDVEIKTGLPACTVEKKDGDWVIGISRETDLKKAKEDQVRNLIQRAKIFDNYVDSKGVDSTLAVVHIDGNNMGLRIRKLIDGIEDYGKAVNKMREISYCINNSYKSVYEQMENHFNGYAGKGDGKKQYNVLKILTAGDDITYVCKGKYALSTVEYFCREIGEKTMNGGKDEKDINLYGFSVCAGVAYIGSHFPFSVGYEVAEACCDSAKDMAKKPENMLPVDQDGKVITNVDGTAKAGVSYKIGNWVDFQICKNIHTGDLDKTRKLEYVTSHNEKLLIRPYELPLLNLKSREGAINRYEDEDPKKNIQYKYKSLKKNIRYFQNDKNIPHSHAKKLRNLYSSGQEVVNEFAAFLASRGWKMPDGTVDMYTEDNQALWYDALELFDCFDEADVEKIQKEETGHGDL